MGSTGGGYKGTEGAQLKTLNRIANKTRNLKNEQYRIVDKDGNVLLEKHGGRGEVATTVGEKRQYLENNIAIHNHPDGGTFSSADLTAFGFRASEIWVAAPEGTYRLINTKAGTPEATNTWVEMQEAYEKAAPSDLSYITLRNKAEEAPHIKSLRSQISALSQKWLKARDSGASQDTLDGYMKQYDKLSDQIKTALRAEVRRVETEPNHDWFKKNASKYGFKYVFEPKKTRNK